MRSTLSCEGAARTLVSGAGVLRYHEAGHGPPLVLLDLASGVAGPSDFRDALPAFAEFFHCLILELPGFGDDSCCDPMQARQDALVRFVAALELESVDIMGHSVGGSVAVDYAIRYPDKVHRLVTVGGSDSNLLRSDGQAADIGNTSRDRLVQTPTLIIWGRDDQVTPLETAIATMSGFANAQLHVFPNCGHWPMIEQREAFETVVLSFLLQQDPPEYLSGAVGFRQRPDLGSRMTAAVSGGCTVRPTVQYGMGQ